MADKRPFSLLIDELPRHIYIQDGTIEIDIKTDTLTALQCLSMLDTDDVPDSIKVSCVIETILAEGEEITPDLYIDAFSSILEYLKGYPVEGTSRSREPIFSYSQDHAYIVAAFRQAYGMSLEDIQKTHWWEFQALLTGLPEDTRLSQIRPEGQPRRETEDSEGEIASKDQEEEKEGRDGIRRHF